MAKIDKTYHELLKTILNDGFKYEDPNRKGTNRIQIPSYTLEHSFSDGFPAITTKKLYWKGVVGELLWILRGDTNIKYLVDNNINIWNKDAYNWYKKTRGDSTTTYEDFIKWIKWTYKLGGLTVGGGNEFNLDRVYGAQLRKWCGNKEAYGSATAFTDQFAELINTLKTNPMATKKTVTFWNPAEKDQCALTPCHWSFEILVEPLGQVELIKYNIGKSYTRPIKYKFTLKWHQHSVDTFLGLPFNIASYALLAQIIGKMTNMVPKGIIGDLSNVHIYEPHLDAVKEQLSRNVDKYGKCELEISKIGLDSCRISNKFGQGLDDGLNQMMIKDFNLKAYKSYPRISAEMLPYNK